MLRSAFNLTRMALSLDAATRADARYRIANWSRGIDLHDVSPEEAGLDPATAVRYTNSGGPRLEAVLRDMRLAPGGRAIDIGCGKGGAVLTLAGHFAQADGIELSPALSAIARRNLERAGAGNSTIFCADATTFTAFDVYDFVYMYHPFPEPLVALTIANLCGSLRRRPRQIVLLYYTPLWDRVIVDAGFEFVRAVDLKYQAKVFQWKGD